MKGTLICSPINGILLYSPDLWVDPTYAILEGGRGLEFTLATDEQVSMFADVPTYPGEYCELGRE